MPHPKGGYRLNGKRVPGVTTIIGRFDDKESLIKWAFRCGAQGKDYKVEGRTAADTGSAAHDGIEDYLRCKKPDWDKLRIAHKLDDNQLEDAKRCVSAFYAWRAKNKPLLHEAELDYVSSEYRFGGCPDAICTIGGNKDLLDWKTSKTLHKGYITQASAYVHLWETAHGEMLDGATIVRFDKKDGDYQEIRLPREELDAYFEEFVKMRELYDIKVRNGTIRYAKL